MPPEEVQGVLGRAFSDFARDIDTAKTHLSRLAEGSVIVGAVRGMRPEDQAALATSFVPGVGDAAGLYADYTDIRENWDQVPWYDKAGMVGAAALGAVPVLPSRSQLHAGAEIARDKSLQFLHNTSAEKLNRIERMGGMPMPSLAVTDKSIPFDSFGDITLVGNPSSFDPKSSKLNDVFSADAYTVRAPSPVRVAKKGAGKIFQEKYKESEVYISDTAANIWNLEKKGDADLSAFQQVDNFFDRSGGEQLFAKEKGINLDNPRDSYEAIKPYRDSGEFGQWKMDQMDEIFEDGEMFVTNPNRDYYTQKARLKPYTAEELTKFMKKSAGAGGEGGMVSNSPGAVRAATTSRMKNLQAMVDKKESLKTAEDMAEFKQTSGMIGDDLQEAFKPYYKYDSDRYGYGGEFNDMVIMSERNGLSKAFGEVGFEGVPDDLVQELTDYKNLLRSAPTEYFEAKPRRVVGLQEFGGAIVPEGTSPEALNILKRHGIDRIESYTDEASKSSARAAFQDLMFSLGLSATVAGGLVYGSGQVSPEDGEGI